MSPGSIQKASAFSLTLKDTPSEASVSFVNRKCPSPAKLETSKSDDSLSLAEGSELEESAALRGDLYRRAGGGGPKMVNLENISAAEIVTEIRSLLIDPHAGLN